MVVATCSIHSLLFMIWLYLEDSCTGFHRKSHNQSIFQAKQNSTVQYYLFEISWIPVSLLTWVIPCLLDHPHLKTVIKINYLSDTCNTFPSVHIFINAATMTLIQLNLFNQSNSFCSFWLTNLYYIYCLFLPLPYLKMHHRLLGNSLGFSHLGGLHSSFCDFVWDIPVLILMLLLCIIINKKQFVGTTVWYHKRSVSWEQIDVPINPRVFFCCCYRSF